MSMTGRIWDRITSWLEQDRPAITPERIEMVPMASPELTEAQTLMLGFFGNEGAPLRDPKAPHAYRPTPPKRSRHTNTRPIYSAAHGRIIMTTGKLFKGHRP